VRVVPAAATTDLHGARRMGEPEAQEVIEGAIFEE